MTFSSCWMAKTDPSALSVRLIDIREALALSLRVSLQAQLECNLIFERSR